MATFNYTTREFREKQALILDKVDAGEDIIIHRGIKKSYMLVPVHKEDYTISEEFREKIAKAREDYKAGKGVTCKTIEQSMSLLETLSKILCKWKQDSAVSLFLYLDSVFKNKHKLIHNQAPVMNRLCPFLLNLHK